MSIVVWALFSMFIVYVLAHNARGVNFEQYRNSVMRGIFFCILINMDGDCTISDTTGISKI